MNKKDAIETVRSYMGRTPKGYEWCVVTTGNEEPDLTEISVGLVKKEDDSNV